MNHLLAQLISTPRTVFKGVLDFIAKEKWKADEIQQDIQKCLLIKQSLNLGKSELKRFSVLPML